MPSLLDRLECARCGHSQEPDALTTVCPKCHGPFFARYDLEKGKEFLGADAFASRPPSMWRYSELLPVRDERHIVTLGEGSTPTLHMARLGDDLGLKSLLLKDESRNPTTTFKARGLSACVSRNHELGADKFAIPTAGNAGGALAAYAAAAGCDAFVCCPEDTPVAARIEVHVTRRQLRRVPGSIADAAKVVAQKVAEEGYFDVSTFKEPYRLEGKKTMGFEIAEALNWNLPDVIIYPTGGGTGLVGIWKAFDELAELGLLAARRPRMVAVQAEGCAPIVKALAAGADEVAAWKDPRTLASGLRVPKPYADREILEVLRASDGTALAVEDEAILRAGWDLASREGVWAAPEGAATVAALRELRQEGWIDSKETVLLLNTGGGQKYTAVYEREPPAHEHEAYDPHDH